MANFDVELAPRSYLMWLYAKTIELLLQPWFVLCMVAQKGRTYNVQFWRPSTSSLCLMVMTLSSSIYFTLDFINYILPAMLDRRILGILEHNYIQPEAAVLFHTFTSVDLWPGCQRFVHTFALKHRNDRILWPVEEISIKAIQRCEVNVILQVMKVYGRWAVTGAAYDMVKERCQETRFIWYPLLLKY